MTIRIYLRVSSDSQDVQSQRHACNQWLSVYGNGADVAWYIEEGISGDAKVRPEYARIREEAVAGDTVLCFALDRLSREGIVPLLKAWNDFQARGVRVVSISEPWADTANPAAEVVIAVLAWAGAQEKKRIKERQRAGIAAARARGVQFGGTQKGRIINRNIRPAARAKRLIAEGRGATEIARITGLARATVYRLMENAKGATA